MEAFLPSIKASIKASNVLIVFVRYPSLSYPKSPVAVLCLYRFGFVALVDDAVFAVLGYYSLKAQSAKNKPHKPTQYCQRCHRLGYLMLEGYRQTGQSLAIDTLPNRSSLR